MTAEAFGLPVDQVEIAPGVDIGQWPSEIAKLGVGIAPLADTLFSRSKSHLKPLEMSACGVPWIASPTIEYVKLYKLGAGLIAPKPKDWYRLTKSLIEDPVRRSELSEAGRKVADSMRLVDHAWKWAEAWEQAYQNTHSMPKAKVVL